MINSSSSITAPNSSSRTAAVIVVTVMLNPGFLFLPEPAFLIATCSAGLLFVLALLLRDPMAVHVTMLTFLVAVCAGIWSWPIYFLVPLIVYAIVVAVTPSLRQTISWLRLGEFDWLVCCFIVLTVFLSSAGLLLWFLLGQSDLNRQLALVPNWSPVLLIAAGLGFALANATIEESIYRGVLMQGLDTVFGPGKLSVILQAVPFGLIHLNGTPSGWLGVSMAGVYGLMLGSIRRRSQGMLAPFVAHVFADIVIFSMLVIWAKKEALL
jgi:membrane protease YdiL (CAAX protease family)